jgi:hypothetical protein
MLPVPYPRDFNKSHGDFKYNPSVFTTPIIPFYLLLEILNDISFPLLKT